MATMTEQNIKGKSASAPALALGLVAGEGKLPIILARAAKEKATV